MASIQPIPFVTTAWVSVTDGLDHVPAFVLSLHRVALTFEGAYVRVVPHGYVQVAQLRDLLEEANVSRMEPVITSGDDHLRPWAGHKPPIRPRVWKPVEDASGITWQSSPTQWQ